MNTLIKVLSESNGQISSVRVMSFIALLIAGILTLKSITSGVPVDTQVLIIWLTAAFCPKVIQKFAESTKKS